MADTVQIFEVGPRDGLQNESNPVLLQDKIKLIQNLVHAGIQNLELGAFVRQDRVPQMADTEEIYRKIQSGTLKLGKARSWALVPNSKGLERALQVGATRIAVFTAATNSFTEKNIGMSIQQSLREFRSLIQDGRSQIGSKLKVRGYVSTAFGCPYEGKVAPKKALRIIEKLAELDVDQISIGDTIGVATPKSIQALMAPALRELGVKKLAIHLHDTRGTALANTLRALDLGIRIIDSSAGGLGGCPFAPGASGNLATEDLVYMLNGMGMRSGVNLDLLCKASLELSNKMKRPLTSRYLQAFAHSSNSCF
jgi:hydroxymethylglutaryl-CoA lyase